MYMLQIYDCQVGGHIFRQKKREEECGGGCAEFYAPTYTKVGASIPRSKDKIKNSADLYLKV